METAPPCSHERIAKNRNTLSRAFLFRNSSTRVSRLLKNLASLNLSFKPNQTDSIQDWKLCSKSEKNRYSPCKSSSTKWKKENEEKLRNEGGCGDLRGKEWRSQQELVGLDKREPSLFRSGNKERDGATYCRPSAFPTMPCHPSHCRFSSYRWRETPIFARLDDTGRRPPPDTISSSFLLFPLPAGKGDKSILVSGQICLQNRFLTRCIVDGNSFRRISPSCSPSTRNNLITYQNIYKSIYSIYISI